MIVHVNGTERDIPDQATVAELLDALKITRDGVAVAVDRRIIPRSALDAHRLEAGARIDVVRAVGGG